MTGTFLAMVRFRWLCLPRFVRALLWALMLISVAFALLGIIGYLIVLALSVVHNTFGFWGTIIIVVFVLMVLIMTTITWEDVEPSIKRKDDTE